MILHVIILKRNSLDLSFGSDERLVFVFYPDLVYFC